MLMRLMLWELLFQTMCSTRDRNRRGVKQKVRNGMTNGERLRQMTYEEFAMWFCGHTLVSCDKCAFDSEDDCVIEEWLEQESEEQNDN